MKVAVGTSDAATTQTLNYTDNGMLATLKDGEDNLTTFEHDGFDRLLKTRFPVGTKGANASSTTDYQQLTYDDNSNVTARRLRDGATVNSTYDKLNRLTNIAPPSPEPGTTYGYDNLGRLISSDRGGYSQSFTYDALGRNLTQVSPQGTLTSEWDAAGRRTKLTYPGTGLYLNYDYLLTGEVTKVRENGATTGIGVLVTYGYDDLGERTSATYGNGASQAFGYDTVSRLSSLTVNLSGTTNDLTKTFSYNPANQIVIETRSNTAYAQALANSSQTTTTNGLNELATVNSTSAGYDARGNMTADPVTGKSYAYWVTDNQLHTVGSPSTTLSYDALSRLRSIDSGATTTNYVSDGADQVAEYDGSGVLQKRYAFDPLGTPLVAYNSSGNRSWMLADERGSVVALANDSAVMTVINTYDEYGIPGASNAGAFQYAGMRWLSGAGVYAPTFRAYGAHLGRFNQTDPLGLSGDGPNLYAYVLDDPVNLVDPLGLTELLPRPDPVTPIDPKCLADPTCVIVTGSRPSGFVRNPAPDTELGLSQTFQRYTGFRSSAGHGTATVVTSAAPAVDIKCAIQAVKENLAAIGLDALAIVAAAAFGPEIGAVAALAIGAAQIGNSIAGADMDGLHLCPVRSPRQR